jgi:predicted transcriptional regulator
LVLDPPTPDATFDSMRSESPADTLVPPDLLDEVQAAADEEHRDPAELVREAVTHYLEQRRMRRGAIAEPNHTPAAAAARILELRKGNFLPPGVTIEDLINFGRA